VRGHEPLQLADELGVATEGQVCLDPLLEGHQSELLEAGDLRPREPVVGEVGKGRATPEGEGLVQLGGGRLRLGPPRFPN
jgi:hypothetical protein